MASGSSARPNSASKGFDFGSDDILCDYSNDSSNGSTHSDPVIGSTSASKDFQKSRMARSAIFPAPVYNQQEDSFEQDVIFTVEKSMKKHTDNLMRFLEGISSRLSQLELYCYNLDKSIGEMRSDLTRDHGEADSKLKSLEKHVQEVHRSVQILRDKQELADTQKELAKLHLVQKESSSSSHSQSNEERASLPASDPKRNDNAPETHNQQLALALPQQIAPQPQPQPQPQQQTVAPPPQAPTPNVNQQQSYYLPPTHFSTPQVQSQAPQNQYLPPDPQYRTSQLQDPTRVAPQQTQSQVNQTPSSQPFQVNQTPVSHPFPQYQQQWSQQLPQQAPSPQQPSLQPQVRPPAPYPSYQPSQPSNPSPPETLPNSMPMQLPFSGISQSGPSRAADPVPYGYGGPGRTAQQQPPPQQLKGTYGAQPGDGYAASAGSHPSLPPGNAYMMYESEGGRTHHSHQAHFQQSGYPPSQPNSGNMVRNSPSQPQYVRNHPYNELIEKLVNMGFRGDHVMSVIQRMEESGQPVDFNAVLDRLNVQSSGGPQRGW